MNARFLPILLVAFTLCNPAVHADQAKPKDGEEQQLQRLNGVWVLEAVEQVGMKLKGDQLPVRLRGMTRTIDDKRMTVKSSGREYQCTFTLDASAKPKRIDIALKTGGRGPRTLKGIYQIKDDILQIAEDADKRPNSFKTERGSRSIVYTFRRRAD